MKSQDISHLQGVFDVQVTAAIRITIADHLALFAKVQLGENGKAFELVAVSILLAVISLGVHNFLLARSGNRRII